MQRFRASGFTLIELSIVLVIIGLIVGGVLVGKDMIRAAQHRKIISEVDGFETAAHTFYDKYRCLPGDCNMATRFWGTTSVGSTQVTSGSCYPTLQPGPYTDRTCDGNGNGAIDLYMESALAWQHLSLAKLTPGQWPGIGGVGGQTGTPGVHIPMSAIPPAGYQLYDIRASGLSWYWYGSQSITGNNFTLGGESSDVAMDIDPFFTALEALQFDSKFDDGNVQTGNIRAMATDARIGLGPGHCNDTTTTDKACVLAFLNRL